MSSLATMKLIVLEAASVSGGGKEAAGGSGGNDSHQLAPVEASQQVEKIFDVGLKSDDELFHVELYSWLLAEKQYERLLNIRSLYLEDFLTRGTSQHPDTLVMFDLLWKYYEKTRNYGAAAKILAKLADRHRYIIIAAFFYLIAT